ncbi:MAG: glycosyltransferase [Patescibacteria group bacterium]
MKFTIVTPVYNGEKYIAETIESVLSQEGDFEIEYLVQDGASTDKTIEIVKSYANRVNAGKYPIHCKKVTMQYFSEKDAGMYDAINKGFIGATGDIYAYINADDYYLPNSFSVIARTFMAFPSLLWVKGGSCIINENGSLIRHASHFIFNQKWIQSGIYGRYAYFIQQESVFWRKFLWDKIDSLHFIAHTHAGDYWLWAQFARHTPLYTIDKEVSCFRRVSTSLSNIDHGLQYRREQEKIIPPVHSWFENKIKFFFWLSKKLNHLETIWVFIYPHLFKDRQKQYIHMSKSASAIKETRSYFI